MEISNTVGLDFGLAAFGISGTVIFSTIVAVSCDRIVGWFGGDEGAAGVFERGEIKVDGEEEVRGVWARDGFDKELGLIPFPRTSDPVISG